MAQFNLGAISLQMGGHVRVGMEDNIYIRKGVLAKSNAELVEKAIRLAREFDREPATPDEARLILGLKGKEKVNF
jgi:3-keto-5-aminohexanoate cleavage enzyme